LDAIDHAELHEFTSHLLDNDWGENSSHQSSQQHQQQEHVRMSRRLSMPTNFSLSAASSFNPTPPVNATSRRRASMSMVNSEYMVTSASSGGQIHSVNYGGHEAADFEMDKDFNELLTELAG
jgi:hypothetical protein